MQGTSAWSLIGEQIPHAVGQRSPHAVEPAGHDWREACELQWRPRELQLRPDTAKKEYGSQYQTVGWKARSTIYGEYNFRQVH